MRVVETAISEIHCCVVMLCLTFFITSDKRRGIWFLPVFVCLSVCLSVSKITQNACMDLDEMLRHCVSTDVGTWTN